MEKPILEVRDLKKHFPIEKGFLISRTVNQVKAVDGINLTVNKGDRFGIVGESGCGKTTILKLILMLEEITAGNILFQGKDITRQTKKDLRKYRASVQPMFQDPYGSLNPRMKIWEIISEPMLANLELTKPERKEKTLKILNEVKLNPGAAELYPHEFSGGQRQRIALARAISIDPEVVILDEPVSALDVSVQAQLMNLLMDLQEKMNLTFIMIAHDLAVVRHMCNRIAVMYLGKVVEYGDSESVYTQHLHPYTQTLLSAALPFHPDASYDAIDIKGEVPNPIDPPSGCHFHPRCPYATDICVDQAPVLEGAEKDHDVACHHWKELTEKENQWHRP